MRAALLALAWLFCGCATTVRMEINASKDSNEGRPVYMVVRTADSQAIVSETYETAAARVFAHPPDPTVRKVQVIMPGQSVDVSLPRPDGEDLVVYFFFTNPGNNWSFPLTAPLPSDVVIEIGTNNVRAVRVRRR